MTVEAGQSIDRPLFMRSLIPLGMRLFFVFERWDCVDEGN